MKKIYLLLFLAFSLTKIQAQTITITDANFAAWLQFTYPTCMNGNQLDITCPAVTSDTLIDISNLSIGNINGIESFTNLKELYCNNNNLSSTPPLPQSLLKFECRQNQLTSVPMLPNSMVLFDCSFNNISSLPSLPNTLATLKCYDNNMTSLPALPTLLKVLHCGGNPMNTLPALPQLLEELDCQGLGLQDLPSLPFTLKILACPYNELTVLPTLPNSLVKLHAFNNQIGALPTLPNTLENMNVSSNNLVTLPALPASLTYINCQSNEMTSVPAFPNNLKYFYCRYNLLTALPQIPNSMRILDCSYNPIECLDFVAGWNHSEPAYFYFDNTAAACKPTFSLNLEPLSLSNYFALPFCGDANPNGCAILGVDENISTSLKIYPNPTTDFIQIESTTPLENVELYDMAGRKVMTTVAYSTHLSVDVSILNNGLYILKSGAYTTKLIKR